MIGRSLSYEHEWDLNGLVPPVFSKGSYMEAHQDTTVGQDHEV